MVQGSFLLQNMDQIGLRYGIFPERCRILDALSQVGIVAKWIPASEATNKETFCMKKGNCHVSIGCNSGLSLVASLWH